MLSSLLFIVVCICPVFSFDFSGSKAETNIQENNKWQVWSAANNLSVHPTIYSYGPDNKYQ